VCGSGSEPELNPDSGRRKGPKNAKNEDKKSDFEELNILSERLNAIPGA
jgi:hypothetical protein